MLEQTRQAAHKFAGISRNQLVGGEDVQKIAVSGKYVSNAEVPSAYNDSHKKALCQLVWRTKFQEMQAGWPGGWPPVETIMEHLPVKLRRNNEVRCPNMRVAGFL